MVTPEVAPFVKVGGLADMLGSLAKVLTRRGHDVRVVCPLYGSVQREGSWSHEGHPLSVHLNWHREAFCRLWEAKLEDHKTHYYFLEYDRYFHRHEVYSGPWGAHEDNHERFAFLSRAAIDLCYSLDWVPDVIHAHDWPCGLVPVYLNSRDRYGPLGQTASVFTIHNLEHQGIFGREVMDFAGLPYDLFRPDGLESMGSVNMMKGGIYHATKLTTVSPTYAKEIQTPEGGCGLNHVLHFRAGDLIGILNGIDAEVWNPSGDPFLPEAYSADDLSGKATCKRLCQEALGLEVDPHVALFVSISRLCAQKGIDLLATIVPRILANMHVQIAYLGTGEQALEHRLMELSHHYPGRMASYIGYDNPMAHLLEAGADFFVMPSRFEPCGLTQMYSMAYGSPPIARATGGLVDSVDPYNEHTGEGTGFLFEDPTEDALYYTMGWACSTYYDRPEHYKALQVNGMKKDFSWSHSADQYEQVYSWAVEARRSSL